MGNTIANKILLALLGVYCVIFFVQGSVAFRNYIPSFIFKSELLYIVAYTYLNRKFPFSVLKNNKLLMFFLASWVLWSSAILVLGLGEGFHGLQLATNYFFRLFHALFFVYAISTFQLVEELDNEKPGNQAKRYESGIRLVFFLLCLLTFGVAFSARVEAIDNSFVIFQLEVLFVLASIFVARTFPDLGMYFRDKRTISLIFVFWIISITISYWLSPNNQISSSQVYARYDYTVMHALFFLFSFEFLKYVSFDKRILLLMLPGSVAILVVIYFLSWGQLSFDEVADWFGHPPWGSMIRHVGYIITASTCVALTFFLYPGENGYRFTLTGLFLLVSASFLFWTGGRAAAGSVAVVFIALATYLAFCRKLRVRRFWGACFIFVLAITFAELFSVFEWNGVISQIARTKGATNVNSLLTGRSALWATAFESLKGHWLFGLGPQGYFFMSNRLGSSVQPHNMFVQFLVEWGIIGTSLFLALLFRAVFVMLKFVMKTREVKSLMFLSAVAVFVGLTIHGFVDGTYYYGQPGYYIALALAIALSEMSVDRKLHNLQSQDTDRW